MMNTVVTTRVDMSICLAKKKKKARLVCDLGMLKILPSFGFGILPMQHIKELHIQPACSKGYLIWQV